MARNNDRDRGSKRVPLGTRPGASKKICAFCKDQVVWVDYKDINGLRRFVTDRGKIRSRRVTGNCDQHQRDVQVAIKTAREIALLPYVQRTASDRGPGKGPRRADLVAVGVTAGGDAVAPVGDEPAGAAIELLEGRVA